MNIDERLEALTHSVDLLAVMHKDNEAYVLASEKRRQDWTQATEKRLRSHDKQMKRLNRHIVSMLQLALDHETRLRAIEGEDDDDTDSALV